MKPNCEMVEYANTRLMSFWATAMVAANNAVNVPMKARILIGVVSGLPSTQPALSNGKARIARYTPADTMVAAWIMAEIGVGPSMASGSQMCKGNWADLPIVPMNRSNPHNPASDSPIIPVGTDVS